MGLATAFDFGRLIRDRRRELGLDQRTLAARAGVSRQWLIEVEQGKPRAELGLVLNTLAALGVRLSAEMAAMPNAASAPPAQLLPPAAPDWPPPIDLDAIIDRARGRPPGGKE